MATIEKRGEFSYRALIRIKGYPSKSRTFMTKKDAERWAKQTETDIERGIFIDLREAQRTTLKDALSRYAQEISIMKKSAKRELGRVKWWQKHALASRSLSSLRGSDFANIRNQDRIAGYAENTIRLKLLLISHLFEVARKEWGMEGLRSPIGEITLPKGSNQRKRRYEKDEEAYLLKAMKTINNEAATIIMLAVETTMRQGEILDLRWSQIDFESKTIFIEGEKNYLSDNLGTKNNNDKWIPLSPQAIILLRKTPRQIKSDRVFQIRQDWLIRLFKRACLKGQQLYFNDKGILPESFLVDLKFHDLRHEGISRLLKKYQLNIMEVKSISGHKTLSMLTRYTHLRATDLADKMRKLS
jgi:integrase